MPPEIPNCFYRVSIKGLILDETRTKFLIVQEDNGKWELPGGGLDWGETPQDALKREIQEEMGLEITWVAAEPSYFIVDKNLKGLWRGNVVYEATLHDLIFTPSSECVAVRFVSPEEVSILDSFHNVQQLAKVFNASRHNQ